jgi:hypothetical protein
MSDCFGSSDSIRFSGMFGGSSTSKSLHCKVRSFDESAESFGRSLDFTVKRQHNFAPIVGSNMFLLLPVFECPLPLAAYALL